MKNDKRDQADGDKAPNRKRSAWRWIVAGKLILTTLAAGCGRGPHDHGMDHTQDARSAVHTQAARGGKTRAPNIRRSQFFRRMTIRDVGPELREMGIASLRLVIGHHSVRVNLRDEGGHRRGQVLIRRSRGNNDITLAVRMPGLDESLHVTGEPMTIARTTLGQILEGRYAPELTVMGGAAQSPKVARLLALVKGAMATSGPLRAAMDHIEFSALEHSPIFKGDTSGSWNNDTAPSSVGDDSGGGGSSGCEGPSCGTDDTGGGGSPSSVGDDSGGGLSGGDAADQQDYANGQISESESGEDDADDEDDDEESQSQSPVCPNDDPDVPYDLKPGEADLTTEEQEEMSECLSEVLDEIAQEHGLSDVTPVITDGTRSVEDQAREMFAGMVRGDFDAGLYGQYSAQLQGFEDEYDTCSQGGGNCDWVRDQLQQFIQGITDSGGRMSAHQTGQAIDVRLTGWMQTYAGEIQDKMKSECGASKAFKHGYPHLHVQWAGTPTEAEEGQFCKK